MANDSTEWGKLSQGQRFQILALDVFRGLALAGLGAHEWIVMEYVLEQSWHTPMKARRGKGEFPDAVGCELSVRGLARTLEGPDADPKALEVTRKMISRAKTSLIARNILIDGPEGFTPNKNVDSWKDRSGKGPALSPAWRSYAASVQNRRNGEVPPATQTFQGGHSNVPGGGPPESSRGGHSNVPVPCHSNVPVPCHSNVPVPCHSNVPVPGNDLFPPPYIGSPASADLEDKKELKKTETPVKKDDASLLGGETKEDDRESLFWIAERLARSQDCKDSEARIRSIVDSWMEKYPADLISRAMDQAMVKQGTGGIWQYVTACLVTLKADADYQAKLKAEREKPYVGMSPEDRAWQRSMFSVRDGRKINAYTGKDMGPIDVEQIRRDVQAKLRAFSAARNAQARATA